MKAPIVCTPYGHGVLNNLSGTPRYLSWLARVVRPHLGREVLEIGAGIGNMTRRLMAWTLLYMVAEKDPLYLHALRTRFFRTPNVVVQRIDPAPPADFAGLEGHFDTVLCVNMLEFVDDPRGIVETLRVALKPNGNAVIVVSQNPKRYGSFDRCLGHKRRFSKSEIRELVHSRDSPSRRFTTSTRLELFPGFRIVNDPVHRVSGSHC